MIEHAQTPPMFSLAPAAEWLHARAWIAGWWIFGRGLVFAVVLIVHFVGPIGWLRRIEHAHTLGVLHAWDSHWYRMVAANGYLLVPGRQSDPAFFPLFPVMLRIAHGVGISYSGAGLVISNLGFLVALFAFHALTRQMLGDELARRATVYLSVFPFGYVFSMDYPESVVLALIALATLAAMRRSWLTAAACASAAALARPEGLFIALPLAVLAWRQRGTLTASARGCALAAIVAPPAVFASFLVYLDRVLHDPLAWSKAQREWGRHFSPVGFVHAFTHVGSAFAHNPWVVRDIVAVAAYLVLLGAGRHAGVPWPWLISGFAVIVLPLLSGSFDSISRFGLLVPALFWGLASLTRTKRQQQAMLTILIALLVAATATIPLVFP
jgi:hypothetical protein